MRKNIKKSSTSKSSTSKDSKAKNKVLLGPLLPTAEMKKKRLQYIADFIDMLRGNKVKLKKNVLDKDESLSTIQAKALFGSCDPVKPFKTYTALTLMPFPTTMTTTKKTRIKVKKTNLVSGSPTKPGTGRKVESLMAPTSRRNNFVDFFNVEATVDDNDNSYNNNASMEFDYEFGSPTNDKKDNTS